MRDFYKIILLIVLFSTNVKSKINIDKIQIKESFSEYIKLAIYMAKEYMGTKTNTIAIREKSYDKSVEKAHQMAILNDIMEGLNDQFAMQLLIGSYDEKLLDYNIFMVDSFEAFEVLRYSFPTNEMERSFNFLVLLIWNSNNETELHETIYNICDLLMKFNVRNVVIMIRSLDGHHISFYSYEMFTEGNCEQITIREINRYENGSLQNDFLFLDYIHNFHGCLFNVSAREVQPLLNLRGDVNNKTHLIDSHRLSGIEGDILKMAAKALNFKFYLHFPQQENIINRYFNSTGCFFDLDINHAQIVIGGFSSAEPNNAKYSMSMIYHTTSHVFVVRSGLSFGPIEQLLNPFRISIWSSLLVLFLISFICTKILQLKPKLYNFIFGPKNKKPIGSMFATFFGISIPTQIIPTRNFARFLLIMWLLLSFELRNCYQGKMFDSLRLSKRIPVPRTISQIIEQDYTLLSEDYNDYYPKSLTVIVNNKTNRLDTVQKSKLRYTSIEYLDSLAYYNYLNQNSSSLTYVEEIIHMFPCVMYFKKYSLLHSSVNQKLKQISEAGITSYIAKQYVSAKFQNMNLDPQFVSRLTNERLKGLYFIIGLMYLLAIFVFIFELLSTKSRKLRKIIDGLNSF
ncbi:uncharacterized protein ACRADG_010796 [Cochliomyia hominivorax]